jgi:hypothetical protein
MRWGPVAGRSPRRARRRTLFSATAASGPPTTNETDETLDDQVLDEIALARFVVDNDDYPAAIPRDHPVLPPSVPDRVDDIDQWLEEFAVSD